MRWLTTRRLAAAAVVLVGIAAVVVATRPSETGLSVARRTLDFEVGTSVAAVEASVIATEPGSSRHTQVVTFEVHDVEWRKDRVPLVNGEQLEVPPIPEGDQLTAWAFRDYRYEPGRRYHVLLSSTAGRSHQLESSWGVTFGVTVADQDPVGGTDEQLVEDVRTILADEEDPSTDTWGALLDLARTLRAISDARTAERTPPAPGPRLVRLLEDREPTPTPDRLEAWLDQTPRSRLLGPSIADVPDGADEALGVRWVESLALVAHDPAQAMAVERLVVLTPHGRSLRLQLDDEQDASLVPFVRAEGAWVRLASQPDDAPNRMLTGRLRDVIEPLDDGGRLFVDLRDGSPAVEVLSPDEFDELVLELRP